MINSYNEITLQTHDEYEYQHCRKTVSYWYNDGCLFSMNEKKKNSIKVISKKCNGILN